jgi:hypothetical protein
MSKLKLGVTTDSDLIELSNVLGFPLKIVSSDETPKLNPKEITNLIVNVDPSYSGKNGTHWVCLHIDRDEKLLTYFDPFGMVPQPYVNDFIQKAKKDLNVKAVMIDNMSQDLKADSCGYWCCFFLSKIQDGSVGEFVSKLSLNPKQNEKMLNSFYQRLIN